MPAEERTQESKKGVREPLTPAKQKRLDVLLEHAQLKASGEKFTSTDQAVLDRYARLYGREYCSTGCGECETSCPQGVQIASVMRYRMYFMDYGMEKRAMESYALLKKNASACSGCVNPVCVGSCPYGLSVKDMLCDAHESMSFSV